MGGDVGDVGELGCGERECGRGEGDGVEGLWGELKVIERKGGGGWDWWG